MKKEKEIRASFAITSQTARVMDTVHDKCLVKIETALNLWVEDRTENRVQYTGDLGTYHPQIRSIKERRKVKWNQESVFFVLFPDKSNNATFVC